jgi:hypothetical protein
MMISFGITASDLFILFGDFTSNTSGFSYSFRRIDDDPQDSRSDNGNDR